MELKIAGKITGIDKISSKEFNVRNINSIAKEYPSFRQESKAPT